MFRLYHLVNGNPNENPDLAGGTWKLEKEFHNIHELFDYAPDVAYWFSRHPHATYLMYDHGKGLHWKHERAGWPQQS